MRNPGDMGDTGSFTRMEFRRGVWAGDRESVEVNEVSLEEGWNGMRMNE